MNAPWMKQTTCQKCGKKLSSNQYWLAGKTKKTKDVEHKWCCEHLPRHRWQTILANRYFNEEAAAEHMGFPLLKEQIESINQMTGYDISFEEVKEETEEILTNL